MFRLLIFLYPFLYTIYLLTYCPFFLYRWVSKGRYPVNLSQRLGKLPPEIPDRSEPRRPALWVHAVSVGEVNAMRSLVDKLGLEKDELFFSTITETGQQLAQDLFRDRAHIFHFPLDWQWVCRRYLRALRPTAVLLVETEIWPGFLRAAQADQIPLLLINGRISDKSFLHYQKIRFFLAPLLATIDRFCMQSRQDKERILRLGAPPARVHWIGNLKYDYSLPQENNQVALVEQIRQTIKRDPDDLLWVCGSTRDQEEVFLVEAYRILLRDFPRLKLLLAPRHPHRAESAARLLEANKFSYIKRSDLRPDSPDQLGRTRPQILLLDSIGELAHLYQLADVVFIGGSLVPTGGHNLIEAAYFGKPILFGPHMENFKEISGSFLHAYAALQVHSTEELISRIRELLKDPGARSWLGRNARKVLKDNQGAVERTVEIVREYLGG